ncbi:MAG: hypothetical protein K2I08_01735, partial [Muribaculaceae bacterium]|nr:hypothetical protein [Muribaculaceae bacterium]
MSDIIKRHNFDQALRRIEQFSNSTPSVPYISKFETDGGLFGWGNHYINGTEMNNYVEKVQDHFSKQNSVLISTIKEFREVYNTFNFLDKEYLQGIVSAVEAANKASEGAKVASNQAKEAAVKALKNEDDIRKEVEALRKIVEKIKSIREDLNTKILKLENSIKDSKTFFIEEISKRILSYSDLQILKSGVKTISDLNQLSDKVELLWEEMDDIAEQLIMLKNLLISYQKDYTEDVLNIRKDSDVLKKEIFHSLAKVDRTVAQQQEEYTGAIDQLRRENEEQHQNVSERLAKADRTVAQQREEYTGAIDQLRRENEEQ